MSEATDGQNRQEGARAPGRSIRFSRVSKWFSSPGGEPIAAVDTLDLVVPASQFVAIVGPSGCGKSTLLRLANGLLAPDLGQVEIGDAPPVPGPSIGMAFQNFRLIPWRNVAENVGFALEAEGVRGSERARRITEQLEMVGLGQWAAHYPAQLSGGMRQRVALARALVGGPDVLLMDEPFASLDAQTRELMQEDLIGLWEGRRPTIMFVTHSVDEALLLADRVIVMGRGTVLEDLQVRLPRPRAARNARQLPDYVEMRAHLWSQIRQLVVSDPDSPFFGRGTETSRGSASGQG